MTETVVENVCIDEEFRQLIPPLSAEEFAQLEANILRDGCRDALVVWSERGELPPVIIDGHNRYTICRKHDLPFETIAYVFSSRNDAREWIIRNQFGRRNLSAFTRAELALKLKPLIAAKAEERMLTGKAANPTQKSSEGETRQQLGVIAGVSHDTIHKAEVIASRADEETKAKLRTGETSINAEYQRLTSAHVANNSGEHEWYTPAEYIDAARFVMGSIDTDPASSEVANRTVQAMRFYTKENDGLQQRWSGRVWLNPPYAQPLIAQFSEAVTARYESGEIEQACILVNNATETAWFQQMLAACSAVCFIRGRIKFIDPVGNASGAPLQGQAVLYMGMQSALFREAFSPFGVVLVHA